MGTMQVTLNKAATVLKCHPRTVLRALTGEDHPSWSASFNPTYDIPTLARGYQCNREMLEEVFRGNDKLLTQAEAAKALKMSSRNLRYRAIGAFIRRRGVVRYLKTTIELADSGIY